MKKIYKGLEVEITKNERGNDYIISAGNVQVFCDSVNINALEKLYQAKVKHGFTPVKDPSEEKGTDVWEKMYKMAKNEYYPVEVSPFITAHHVVAAIESTQTGEIYTGFCIEGASGVIALCAERVAGLKMYAAEGNTEVRRLIAFRDKPPMGTGGSPCGACREFFMQLDYRNRNMDIMVNYKTRETIKLKDLIPNWWGDKRYKEAKML